MEIIWTRAQSAKATLYVDRVSPSHCCTYSNVSHCSERVDGCWVKLYEVVVGRPLIYNSPCTQSNPTSIEKVAPSFQTWLHHYRYGRILQSESRSILQIKLYACSITWILCIQYPRKAHKKSLCLCLDITESKHHPDSTPKLQLSRLKKLQYTSWKKCVTLW